MTNKKKSFINDNPALNLINTGIEETAQEEKKETPAPAKHDSMQEDNIKASSNNDVILYGLKECEKLLGLTRRTLLKYISEGKIKAIKIGNRWKVTKENLNKFMDNCQQS